MSPPSQERARPALPADLDRLLHELRGPLNSAVMHLELVKRLGPDDPTGRDSVQIIQQELGRLATLLPLAFSIAALEIGPPTRVDLRAIVDRVLEEPGLGGVTVADAAWRAVRGDPELLTLGVTHLVRNAVEATQAAGEARRPPHVSAEQPSPETVVLVVRDWGTGVLTSNPRALIRLSSSTKPGRVGTGLVTVDRVARLHGGALDLVVPAEGGLEARLTLPAG
jgi:signal transduction histidine kinase